VDELLHLAFGLEISGWAQMLTGLLGLGFECRNKTRQIQEIKGGIHRSSVGTQDPRQRPNKRHSSRSLSPGQSGAKRPRRTESRTPVVFVVDLRDLFRTMRGIQYEAIYHVASELNIAMEEGWCAGNECR
jgi:hypothetical protein